MTNERPDPVGPRSNRPWTLDFAPFHDAEHGRAAMKKLVLLSALALMAWQTSAPAQNLPADRRGQPTPARPDAVIWSMPSVNYDLMRQQMLTNTNGKGGKVIYWGRPLDSKNQTLTPNPDALYFMTFFDTKDGPVVLDLPPGDANGSFNGNIVT